jgi:hypothetical protein
MYGSLYFTITVAILAQALTLCVKAPTLRGLKHHCNHGKL